MLPLIAFYLPRGACATSLALRGPSRDPQSLACVLAGSTTTPGKRGARADKCVLQHREIGFIQRSGARARRQIADEYVRCGTARAANVIDGDGVMEGEGESFRVMRALDWFDSGRPIARRGARLP